MRRWRRERKRRKNGEIEVEIRRGGREGEDGERGEREGEDGEEKRERD